MVKFILILTRIITNSGYVLLRANLQLKLSIRKEFQICNFWLAVTGDCHKGVYVIFPFLYAICAKKIAKYFKRRSTLINSVDFFNCFN